jgi:hypothetical protein
MQQETIQETINEFLSFVDILDAKSVSKLTEQALRQAWLDLKQQVHEQHIEQHRSSHTN